jgi:hypothetical protein
LKPRTSIRSTISKKHRYRRSELRYCCYIPVSKIYRYRQMLLRYLYTELKLCASISNFVFFNVGVSLSDPAWAAVAPTWYCTQNVACTLHCESCESIIARGSCAVWAALSRRSRGCTQRRGRTGLTGRSTCCSTDCSRQSGARTSRVLVSLLVRAEGRSDQQRTSSRTWFQSHRDRSGGRQGSHRGVL